MDILWLHFQLFHRLFLLGLYTSTDCCCNKYSLTGADTCTTSGRCRGRYKGTLIYPCYTRHKGSKKFTTVKKGILKLNG